VSSDVRKVDPVAPVEVVIEGSIPESEVDLGTSVGSLRLRTPVLSASGCFASGAEIDRFHDITELGAVVVKSVTARAA
jgi:dihydroorotate dehydrogenase (NAD+) catalytic subunit